MSQEGIFCKTWEAQLIRGGMTDGSGAFGVAPFDFTVPTGLVEAVQDAMREQREISIEYTSRGVWPICQSKTGHFLNRVTVHGDLP